MVHQQSYDHRHSSYHPPPAAFSETSPVMNKNYEHQQQGEDDSLRQIGKNNNNNNNNSSSSPSASSNAVNDNDTFARFWPQPANNGAATSSAATLLAGHPCGPITSGTNGNNSYSPVENDVRWSKLLRHDGTPTKVKKFFLLFDYRQYPCVISLFFIAIHKNFHLNFLFVFVFLCCCCCCLSS